MRVLVTGATGFIGRHLVRRLSQEGHHVVSLSRSENGPPEAAEHLRHDLGSETPFPALSPVASVIHLGARSSVIDGEEDPAGVARVNVQGTLSALLFARSSGASFILASSQRVYRPSPAPLPEEAPKEPRDLYGYTKLAAESYVAMGAQLFAVPGAILRFFSVYGPGQVVPRGTSGVVSILAQRAISGAPLVVMSQELRDLVEVSDVVDGIVLAMGACRCPPPAYNIATGVPTSIFELAKQLRAAAASGSPIVEQYGPDEAGGLVADIDRARRELHYEPQVGLEEGLHRYVGWLSTRQDPPQGTTNRDPAR